MPFSLMEQMAYKTKRKVWDHKLINQTRLAVLCKQQLEKKNAYQSSKHFKHDVK